jgi:hypothetical protein
VKLRVRAREFSLSSDDCGLRSDRLVWILEFLCLDLGLGGFKMGGLVLENFGFA